MAKNKKSTRNFANPDDVITGRIRLDARELVALIHHVNPTGLGLDRHETTRRYQVKSRLQSLLITRFSDDIDAVPEPNEPGVVALRHLPLDLDACHAVLTELDEDARSLVQHLLDTRDDTREDETNVSKNKKSSSYITRQLDDHALPNPNHFNVSRFLGEGHAALESYDYETARQCFEAAFEESRGGTEAALALLTLLVEQLGVDEEALGLEEKLDATAMDDRAVRTLLAVAAARQGDRARVIRFIETRGMKAPAHQVADIFIQLSKHALTQGDLEQAAKDLARVKDVLSTHPELNAMVESLAKARTTARGPEEAELNRVFIAGNVPDAENRARTLLARFPESEVARRILRVIDEQKKIALTQEQLNEAHAAFENGHELRAMSLFQSALAMGLPPADAALARAQIVIIENNARTRTEEPRIVETLRLLQSENLGEGLSAYARLPESSRRKVAAQVTSSRLTWLDELCPAEESGKVIAAVAAVLALDRAANSMASNPSTALELIAAHEKMLSGFGPAEDVRDTARKAWTEQQRIVAKKRLELARSVFAAGDPQQAQRISSDIAPKYLSDEETSALAELQARIQEAIERRALYAAIEQHKQSDPVRALRITRRLAQHAENDETERIRGMSADLKARTRQAFSVHIEEASTHAPGNANWHNLADARILPKWKFEALMPDPQGGPDDLLLVLPQAKAEWIFVRIVEVSTGRTRRRIRFRTPTTLDPIHFALRQGHLLFVGRFGGLLEMNVDDWSISQWSSSILRPVESITRTTPDPLLPEFVVPDVTIEDAAISSDGRYLWICVLYGRYTRENRNRIGHIFDLDGVHPVRDIRPTGGARIHCRSVPGLEQPTMALVDDVDERSVQRTTFFDPRGRIIEHLSVPLTIDPATLTACPDGKRILASMSDPDGPLDPKLVGWGFIEIGVGSVSPLQFFPNLTAVYHATAATSRESGMNFLLFCSLTGNELIGMQQTDTGLEIVYRVLVPRYSALIAAHDGRQAILLIVDDNGHEIVRLGKTAPQLGKITNANPFRLPKMPMGSLFAAHFNCHRAVGARSVAVTEIENELRKHGKTRYREVLRAAWKRFEADELLLFEEALTRLREPSIAGDLIGRLSHKFPNHPRIRLSMARTLANTSKWSEVLERLDGIDISELDKAGAKHFYHLRGIALMMMNDSEGAIAEFDRSLTYQEGDCEPDELLALCVPVTDTSRSWDNEILVMRDYLACIVTADAALERADLTAAKRAIDVPLIWEANEVQGTARLAETCLRFWEQGLTHDSFHMALALVGFCELFATRRTITRREVPVPNTSWNDDKLGDLSRRARLWIDEVFSVGRENRELVRNSGTSENK